MIYDIILKGGKIVKNNEIFEADVGILNGKISKIGKISKGGKIEKDCSGLFVLPGLIDMHVHLRDPGFTEKEDFYTGSCAAAAGGVTTVIDMPNTNPPTLTCKNLEDKRKIARAKSIVNFGLYMGLSGDGDNLEEIKKAENIAGVKIFMGKTTGDLLSSRNAIEKFFKTGIIAIVHAEDEKLINEKKEKYKDETDPSVHSLIREPAAAYKACKEILHLAKKHNARVHITHVSTEMEIEEIKKFKSDLVSADTTTHHLFLNEAAYSRFGNFVKVNPPIRSEKDRESVWKGLKNGFLDAITTDHAPHTKEEKSKGYTLAPSGIPGLETMLPLLLNEVNRGELNLEMIAKLTSFNPAKILGIQTKGEVAEGGDADLTVVNMNEEHAVGSNGYFSKCGWSPYEGKKLKGWPVLTVVNGNIVFEKGKINDKDKGREVIFKLKNSLR